MLLQFIKDPQATAHEHLRVLGLRTSALDNSDAKI